MPAICRDCDAMVAGETCASCGSARVVRHAELLELAIGHVDCDAFYASVEKRDRPEWRDKPVIVGGGTRGVVATCCYVARLYGVRSAMPMFKARSLCPQAVIVRPDMAKYAEVSAKVRALMDELTPLVQPLSIDEAVLDLSGTATLHNAAPAVTLNRFARRIERELGITVSIGLAHNRMLAKLAAERGKPRGFSVLGREAAALLAPEPVGLLPGVGPAQMKRFAALGFTRVGQLASLGDRDASRLLGEEGPGWAALARGEDTRPVRPERESKSISAETTFAADFARLADLEPPLWLLCEKLGRRLRGANLAAAGVVLKLKTAKFVGRTRNQRLANPTQLPETLFEAAREMLRREADGTAFRLIGIGAAPLVPATQADRGDLADTVAVRRQARQDAIDRLRARFGASAVQRGRGLPKTPS
ncbi:MAG TPA: DNA polymerase IV [Acidocella sp.]|jgi:DNA polymerase-4|uniref:DNA polymerase IV n=1 Tax=Acidocella sp. TaxID=50710 RepID=UPI002BC312F5|nr:DNA polymerase IV [Acidocella sp.]HVE21956.1 DNA polymerase IV [Acidocella sp.]